MGVVADDDQDLGRGIVGDFQVSDHLHGAVCGLGFRCCESGESGESGAGRAGRIEGVGFPDETTHSPVGPVDFDDPMSVAADEGRQADAVGAGAFDAERDNLPETACPVEELLVSTSIGGDRQRFEDPTDRVQDGCNVDVVVGIGYRRTPRAWCNRLRGLVVGNSLGPSTARSLSASTADIPDNVGCCTVPATAAVLSPHHHARSTPWRP